MQENKCFTIKEVANALGVTRQGVYAALRRNPEVSWNHKNRNGRMTRVLTTEDIKSVFPKADVEKVLNLVVGETNE